MVFGWSSQDGLGQAVMAAFSLGDLWPWSGTPSVPGLTACPGLLSKRRVILPTVGPRALWQNLQSLHCNSLLGASQKLGTASFPNTGTSSTSTIGSAGAQSKSVPCAPQSGPAAKPLQPRTDSRLEAFHVAW